MLRCTGYLGFLSTNVSLSSESPGEGLVLSVICSMYGPPSPLLKRRSNLPPWPPAPPGLLLQRKAAPDEDPAQGVCLAVHGHWGTDLQVPKGVEAGDGLIEGLPSHVAEIWALGRGTHPSLVSCSHAVSLAPTWSPSDDPALTTLGLALWARGLWAGVTHGLLSPTGE